MPGNGNGRDRPTFEDELEHLGFRFQGRSRRGGLMWSLQFNRFLQFTLHDFGDGAVVVTWSCELGEYLQARQMQIGAGEVASQELYPRADARIPVDVEAVEAEIRRVLTTLRFDLADPTL